ncbi:glycerol dehydratase reactivase beta/small subunit family protein [Clostridium sp. CCUG 7971]|uniref:glycerol dehydratase reactivase beta/small subunit family protein n=1 Tax=Clostridium sp. CCUG 7971 TaxID=2811414 RepID=UPI001ABB1993|nr:glycerol dehydratase reactivase beta/small subunit family protein [Clostridium sp. CCUG 7971]MBO3444136.1 glycerol dehydratase reactivase beta/small subunit family protein [Clostridium sp. CCUG 7971]
MIIKSYDLDTPSVYVFHCNDIDIDEFKEILWGIEEEGIPYKVESKEKDTSNNLSHEASLKSRLGIGIGISKDKISLTTSKLDKNTPLISIELNHDYSKLRNVGANGARLVKGIELKKI